MAQNIFQVYTNNPITTNASTDLMYFGQSPYGAGDDAGMTFANFAAQFGAPYTPAALTSGNDTNVTLTLGGLPATSLLHAASITAGWTGTLAVGRGGLGIGTTPTDGEIPIGNGTNYTAATLTAGTGITITNGAGSIQIDASGSGFTWNLASGLTQTIAVENGYLTNNGSQVVFSLPATAAQFSTFWVKGVSAGGWRIATTGSQEIILGTSATTVSGYIESTNRYDSVLLICTVANTTWSQLTFTGNITVV